MSVAAAARHPVLDKAEWDLVIDLLECERRGLPVETDHAATRDYRQHLLDRAKMVETLLHRLRTPV